MNSIEQRLAGLYPPPDLFVASALIIAEDGRYLFQLRDDKPFLPLRNHWALFGGEVEVGEDGNTAIIREVKEELSFVASECVWFHEAIYAWSNHHRQIVRKAYYKMPVSMSDIKNMTLCEGSDMRLMTVEQLLALPNIAPWDLVVVLMHSRENKLFDL